MGEENRQHGSQTEGDVLEQFTRRSICAAAIGLVVSGLSGTGAAQDDELDSTIRIVSTDDERVFYEVAAGTQLEAGEDADISGATHPDTVSERRAEGSTAEGGADSYRFSGEIIYLSVDGPAEVFVNDERVPTLSGTEAQYLPNTLTVVSTGTERVHYAVHASGEFIMPFTPRVKRSRARKPT